jgi:methionyl-tRNA synthetase
MSSNKFYITTTLPYVNASPHIGFAAEIIRADVLARWARLQGKEVFFNTGTDEHGLKIHRKALEQGKDTQSYVDEYAAKFDDLKNALDLSYNNFIRTTDENHKRLAQEFWKKCDANGDIYKKAYKVKYCVGCELELTESELVDGKCPHHPGTELETIEEENYFFRWSKYADKLLDFYKKNPDFIVPAHRMNEIKAFIERGLQDFSISRLKAKMPWGVAVPGDDNHVMYVWFDALTNYINCLNWDKKISPSQGESPEGEGVDLMKEFWGTVDRPNAIQVAGKDNLRQQTAMWQAMLLSAGFPTSKQVLIFGFITCEGHKMSKSIGNVVSPYDLVEKYGTDAVRYYLLSELKPFEDSDYSKEKFETKYNADLANGLGNLFARTATLVSKLREQGNEIPTCAQRPADTKDWGGAVWDEPTKRLWNNYVGQLADYNFDRAIGVVIEQVGKMDQYLAEEKPWKTMKEDATTSGVVLYNVIENLRHIAIMIYPFMPKTAAEIYRRIGLDIKDLKNLEQESVFGLWSPANKIEVGESLFPRL